MKVESGVMQSSRRVRVIECWGGSGLMIRRDGFMTITGNVAHTLNPLFGLYLIVFRGFKPFRFADRFQAYRKEV